MCLVTGGFEPDGELSTDPAKILETKRALPIGYWKGSGLTIALDMIAAALASGIATHTIGSQPSTVGEHNVCQVYLAIAAEKLTGAASLQRTLDGVVEALHAAAPLPGVSNVTYPGEGMIKTRKENLQLGKGLLLSRFCAHY
eukprot:SAG31_NODE_5424_length_2546_cov_2.691050_1_plen_142_part_00